VPDNNNSAATYTAHRFRYIGITIISAREHFATHTIIIVLLLYYIAVVVGVKTFSVYYYNHRRRLSRSFRGMV